jgi:GAF domain-containing protein/HAMP domain-containing protein
MNQIDTVRRTGLRRRLADTSLRVKLSIGLGASIVGLLVIASMTIYTSVVNQQLVNRTLTRQRQLADLASRINNNLLSIQNQAFEFYDTWDSTGFEGLGQGGFEQARRTYLAPLQEQIDQIQKDVVEIERLEPDEQTRNNLARIRDNMDAYELTLLQMSDHIESLGFEESGAVGQMRTAMTELNSQLDEPGLESLKATVLEIRRYEKNFFLYSDLPAARLVQDFIKQLTEQIAATDDEQLASEDKAQLNALLESYRDLFLTAANLLNLVDLSRETLINQSDLTSVLVSNLFEQQQAEFNATVERLERQQSNTTFTVIGLALLSLFISVSIAYVVTGQIIQPVQALGEAAGQLGAGELDVRATVYGRDEIGATATAFNLMADQLQEALAGLERRVAERTRTLQTAAEVAHATTMVLDPDELLHRVVNLARERFDLYYVGLFLLDEEHKFAVLRAGTGEAGRTMVAQGHRLEMGGESMIGQCVARAEARIALDVGEEAIRFDHPLLPETRSEMALPLSSRDQVIGAMTVQSVEEAAFDETDVAVMQTMADQVAVAIDNARLFAEAQTALESARRAYGEVSRQAWTETLRARPDWGYRYFSQTRTSSAELSAVPAEDAWRPEMIQAVRTGESVRREDAREKSALAIPLKVRGQVVGVLDFRKGENGERWTAEESALLETLTDQLSVALESARLYQETQRRAVRERLTHEITDKMRRASSVEDIVQAAVDELHKALGTSRTFVRLGVLSSQDDGKDGTRVIKTVGDQEGGGGNSR